MWAGGGGAIALAMLVVTPNSLFNRDSANYLYTCQTSPQSTVVLSRAELGEFLKLPEQAAKADVQAIISEPFCSLPAAKGTDGNLTQRDAYPLEFDPQTWFIVHYDKDQYAEFSFSFRQN
jgi:hypothetical protein